MSNLEHNIKEAFANHDAQTRFRGKPEMWARLAGVLVVSKGVAAFWRVAAIFLALFFVGGAFATAYFAGQQNRQYKQINEQNSQLRLQIDSLKNLSLQHTPKIQVIEKEKVVWKERLVIKTDSVWKQKYWSLSDSISLVLASREGSYHSHIARLESEVSKLKNEIHQSKSKNITENKPGKSPFELKSERVELSISKKPQIKNQELKVQIFQKNLGRNNNLNRTIFTK